MPIGNTYLLHSGIYIYKSMVLLRPDEHVENHCTDYGRINQGETVIQSNAGCEQSMCTIVRMVKGLTGIDRVNVVIGNQSPDYIITRTS